MTQKEAYAIGFAARCDEVGIDADELLKFAAVMEKAPTSKEQSTFNAKAKQRKAQSASDKRQADKLKKSPTTRMATNTGTLKGDLTRNSDTLRDLLSDPPVK